jgi:hypothetical protein
MGRGSTPESGVPSQCRVHKRAACDRQGLRNNISCGSLRGRRAGQLKRERNLLAVHAFTLCPLNPRLARAGLFSIETGGRVCPCKPIRRSNRHFARPKTSLRAPPTAGRLSRRARQDPGRRRGQDRAPARTAPGQGGRGPGSRRGRGCGRRPTGAGGAQAQDEEDQRRAVSAHAPFAKSRGGGRWSTALTFFAGGGRRHPT